MITIAQRMTKQVWAATSKTSTHTLKNLVPEKPGHWKTWTLKNLDAENIEIDERIKSDNTSMLDQILF